MEKFNYPTLSRDEFLIEEDRRVYFKNFKEYVESPLFGDPNDNRFHISLKPVPYEGNLENALIYYLSLNPGLITRKSNKFFK